MSGPVVVGIEAGTNSLAALRYALAEAGRRALPVHLVHSIEWPGGPLAAGLRRDAEQVLDAAVARARRAVPALPVTASVVTGPAGRELVGASVAASLVVIGTSRMNALRLGSTGVHVARQAHCPVVVVPNRPVDPLAPVVVGVDGTEAARLATRYAFDAAAARHTNLVAVHAWRPPTPSWPHRAVTLPQSFVVLRGAERHVLESAVDRWRSTYPSVPVDGRLLPGDPAPTLVAAAARAGLLVVGSRALGTLRGSFAGSVALQVLHQAACPVAVVHPHRHAAAHESARRAPVEVQ